MLTNFKVLISVIALSAALAAAGDIDASSKDSQVESKWYYGGGWGGWRSGSLVNQWNPWINNYWGRGNYYGFGVLPYYGYGYNGLFFKSDDATLKNERRSLRFVARGEITSQGEVTCKNSNGQAERFVRQDCLRAAKKLADNQLSSASCGTCGLSLRGPHGDLTPNKASATELEKVASSILEGCIAPGSVPNLDANTASKTDKGAGLFLSKGNGESCS